jgi:Cu-processing system ATP-binding protein
MASPAIQTLRLVGQQFPMLRAPSVVDAHPRMQPNIPTGETGLASNLSLTAPRGWSTKDFGAVQALNGVTSYRARAKLFGLIGHNGAGKSTLFKMMLGLIARAAPATIRIDGVAVDGPTTSAKYGAASATCRKTWCSTTTSPGSRPCTSLPISRACRAGHARCWSGWGSMAAATRRVREYSKGMRQRLGFAQALLGEPAPAVPRRADHRPRPRTPSATSTRILRELRDEGVTMVLTSHILAEIQERVDRLAIMEAGRPRLGTCSELREGGLAAAGSTSTARPPSCRCAAPGAGVQCPSSKARGGGSGLRIRLRAPAKLPCWQAVGGLAAPLRDLQVREASLEDVFFGYRA